MFLFLLAATKLGQDNVFTSVCDSVHRDGSSSVHAGIPPPQEQTPAPGADTPLGPDPPEQTPRDQTPPQADIALGADPGSRHPPREADSGIIRSTSGRYASYWNAFLFGCKIEK